MLPLGNPSKVSTILGTRPDEDVEYKRDASGLINPKVTRSEIKYVCR